MPSIYTYDLMFLFIVAITVAIFLYKNRKNVKVESKIFLLYHTKVGIKFMNWVSKKLHRLLDVLSYFSISFGFLAMFSAVILLLISFKTLTTLTTVPKVPPLMPLIPYLPEIFKLPLPPFYFSYWITILLVVAITHEFAHGIFARYFGLKVKSTGFGFLGPFLVAFVEPDEKVLQKKSKRAQLSILSAGSFSNFIFAILFLGLMHLFFSLSTVPSNIIYATTTINTTDIERIEINAIQLEGFERSKILPLLEDSTDLIKISVVNNSTFFITQEMLKQQIESKERIENLTAFYDSPLIRANVRGEIKEINGIKVKNYDKIFQNLSSLTPGQVVTIKTTVAEYKIYATEHPKNSSRGFIGISSVLMPATGLTKFVQDLTSPIKNPFMFYKLKYNVEAFLFFFNLIWWLVIISFSIALVNMLPLGILDGGRFIYVTALWLTKSKKTAERVFKSAAVIILLIFTVLMMVWILRAF